MTRFGLMLELYCCFSSKHSWAVLDVPQTIAALDLRDCASHETWRKCFTPKSMHEIKNNMGLNVKLELSLNINGPENVISLDFWGEIWPKDVFCYFHLCMWLYSANQSVWWRCRSVSMSSSFWRSRGQNMLENTWRLIYTAFINAQCVTAISFNVQLFLIQLYCLLRGN